jgi:hypothetical protein
MRSLNAQIPQPETVEITLGRDDGRYLRATLTETPSGNPDSDDLRAAVNLKENQKVRLAAFRSGTSTPEGSTTNYIYSGGKLNAENPAAPLMVEENVSYEIVAYSYFDGTTAYPVTNNIDSSNQLLWGKSAAKTITQSDRSVTITMEQKFARVQVSISTANITGTPAINGISNVAIASEGDRCNLTVYNGDLVTGSPLATQTVAFPTLNASAITSTPRTIYPVATGAKTTITIGSITLNSVAYTNLTAVFNQELLGGHNYTLTVDLNETDVIFAGSNIYWDGSKMTFEPAGYTGEKSFYPGLHFRWGSMVGIAPRISFYANPRIYYPIDATTWSADGTVASDLYASWGAIPIVSPTSEGSSVGTVTNYNGGTPDYLRRTGDICRRIDPNYRLPRAIEFEKAPGGFALDGSMCAWGANSAPDWYKGTASYSSYTMEANGTAVFSYGGSTTFTFATFQGVIFPITFYHRQDGVATDSNYLGTYYSSSARIQYPTFMAFSAYGVAPKYGVADTQLAHSIRCVKN